MKCSQCGMQIPDGSRFCNHCGAESGPGEPLDELQAREHVRAVDEFRRELRVVVTEAVDDIKDKSTRWAKSVLALVVPFVVALGLWGYTSVSGLNDKISEVTREIEGKREEVFDRVTQANEEIHRAEKAALTIIGGRAEAIKSRTEGVEALETRITEVQRSIHDIDAHGIASRLEKSTAEADRLQQEAAQMRKDVEMLQNSFFDVFVHIKGSEDQVKIALPAVLQVMNDDGFVVGGHRVAAYIEVDATEILYYNPAARQKAERLADLLKPQYPGIRPSLHEQRGRNPREVLVKLKVEDQRR